MRREIKKFVFSTGIGFLNRFTTDIFPILMPLIIMYSAHRSILLYSIPAFYIGAISSIILSIILINTFHHLAILRFMLILSIIGGIFFFISEKYTLLILPARFLEGLSVGALPILLKLLLVKEEQLHLDYNPAKVAIRFAKSNFLYPLFPFLIFLIGSLTLSYTLEFELIGIFFTLLSLTLLFLVVALDKERPCPIIDNCSNHSGTAKNITALMGHQPIILYSIIFGMLASCIPIYYWVINNYLHTTGSLTTFQHYSIISIPAFGLLVSRAFNIFLSKYFELNAILKINFSSMFCFLLLPLALLNYYPDNPLIPLAATIPFFICIGLVSNSISAKIIGFFKNQTFELLLISALMLYLISWISVQFNFMFVREHLERLILYYIATIITAGILFYIASNLRSTGIKINRTEWRMELFSEENLLWLYKPPYEKCILPHKNTITIYFQDTDGTLTTNPTLRFRAYISIDEINEESLSKYLNEEILIGALQIKKQNGVKYEICDARISKEHPGPTPFSVSYEDKISFVHSIKIVSREHFIIKSPSVTDTISKQVLPRITLDSFRNFFIMKSDGTLQYLGNLGKRLEYKYRYVSELKKFQEQLLQRMDNTSISPPLRYHSFEPIFQYMFKKKIFTNNGHSLYRRFTEIERKYLYSNITENKLLDEILDFIKKEKTFSFLLPFPHCFSRIRRYHLCKSLDSQDKREYTIIETLAGKYSIKIKSPIKTDSKALIRDTTASHTTDLTGLNEMESLLTQYKLTLNNTFVKYQYKIPFAYENGRAFFLTVEIAADQKKTLLMVELEYCGELQKDRSIDVNEILHLMDAIEHRMQTRDFYKYLEKTNLSKYSFFIRQTL